MVNADRDYHLDFIACLAMTTNLKIGVVHEENPAGRAITKLLASLGLDNERARLFVRAVGREEAAANTASTQYNCNAAMHSGHPQSQGRYRSH